MKKKYLLTGLLSILLIFACTNDNENIVKSDATSENIEVLEPYISPEMAKSIAFLDTCQTVLPIEQLMPIINISPENLYSSSSNAASSITRSTKSIESYTSRSAQKILSMDAAVSILGV
ncbi:MAG: hypothetical protein H6Q14_1564 [Bacteroidetes bacterium]|nr:hypothetical protein [Bacteroidota bacterium]